VAATLFIPTSSTDLDAGRFATAIASLEVRKRRFILAEGVRRGAQWDKSAQDEEIVAEFVAPGHLRLHKKSDIRPVMLSAERRIKERISDPAEQEVARQALRDRYQSADFAPSDRYRVELREESVLALLGERDYPQSVKIFLQVGEKAIDLMTHEVRIARLKQFSV
jgi:hypothetical protein